MTTAESRTLSVRIERPLAEVYAFLAEPKNFQSWAAGLDLEQRIVFTEQNPYGVVDHTVVLPQGQEVYVPMRAIRNGTGTEVLFTVFRQPEMTDDRFAEDTEAVQRDLLTLKRVLEH
ncbi:MAG: SRPBCC family protein [Candidatus Dormibacteraeota bacterium]|nr:SRPBCC family protein [Candidatus Dormibacteraeota bacterium]